jgi:hypothetical protein
MHYLTACRVDSQDDGNTAAAALRGLRAVGGTLPGFSIQYPCHAPDEPLVCDERGANPGASLWGGGDHINVTAWSGVRDETLNKKLSCCASVREHWNCAGRCGKSPEDIADALRLVEELRVQTELEIRTRTSRPHSCNWWRAQVQAPV